MKTYRAAIVLASLFVVAACSANIEYSGDQGGFGGGDVVVDAGADALVGVGGEDGGQGGGDGAQGLPWGAPCNTNAECQSGACIPSPNSFGAGSCFGHDMIGCIKVGKPSGTLDQCAGGSVYVCGDDWPMANMGNCAEVMAGNAGESYQCCTSNSAR